MAKKTLKKGKVLSTSKTTAVRKAGGDPLV